MISSNKSTKKAIHVRIIADMTIVEKSAELIGKALEQNGSHDLVETSKVYPCRAPDDSQGRVYLTFIRRPA